jgi:hypothetical protein
MPAQTSNPTSQLPAPRSLEGVSDRLAEARAADEHWRGDRAKEGGNWRPPHLFLVHLKGREPPLRFSRSTRSLTRKGFHYGRAGPCYMHAAFIA